MLQVFDALLHQKASNPPTFNTGFKFEYPNEQNLIRTTRTTSIILKKRPSPKNQQPNYNILTEQTKPIN